MGAARSRRIAGSHSQAAASPPPSVADRLRRLIEEAAGIPARDVRDDSSLDSDLAMDSMSLVSLQVAVEEEFGIRFDLDDLETARRFDAMARLVEERCAGEAR